MSMLQKGVTYNHSEHINLHYAHRKQVHFNIGLVLSSSPTFETKFPLASQGRPTLLVNQTPVYQTYK